MRRSIRRFLDRYGAAFMGGWYLLVATNGIYVAFDWIAPVSKTVLKPDLPCAYHDCGCETAEQCRSRCCCYPKTVEEDERPSREGPVTVRVSYLSAAQCSGQHPDSSHVGNNKIDSRLPLAASFRAPPLVAEETLTLNESTPPSAFADLPFKVPI